MSQVSTNKMYKDGFTCYDLRRDLFMCNKTAGKYAAKLSKSVIYIVKH